MLFLVPGHPVARSFSFVGRALQKYRWNMSIQYLRGLQLQDLAYLHLRCQTPPRHHPPRVYCFHRLRFTRFLFRHIHGARVLHGRQPQYLVAICKGSDLC